MDKMNSKDNRLRCIAVICGAIYGIIVVFGRQVYLYDSFQDASSSVGATIKTLVSIITVSLLLAIAFFFLFLGYRKYIVCGEKIDSIHINNKLLNAPVKLWIINWIVLFITWLPCYLAYYPGLQSYDAPEQICMITGVFPATTHQPPIHTILLGWAFNGGNKLGIEPIVLYTLVQLVVVSALFSYYMVFLTKHFVKRLWELVLIYLFFTVNPVIPLMAIQPTKDVLFTSFFILCTIYIYEILFNSEIKIYKYILFSLSLTLASLFRNNALYALVAASIIMSVLAKMETRKRVKTIASVLLAIVITNLFNTYTSETLGFAKLDDKVEMSAVPLSQIALVLKETPSTITEDEWREISYFIKDGSFMVGVYNPRFYDPLKDSIYKTNLQEEYGRFLNLWVKLFKKYPVQYITAFMNLNIPYWYPFANTIDHYSNRVYIETNIGESPYTFERASKIPWLLKHYEGIANYSSLDIPVVRTVYGINTPIWVILFGMVLVCIKREYRKIIVFLPAFFLWGTYLFGPVSNFRYIYPIFVLYPLFIALVLHKHNIEENAL